MKRKTTEQFIEEARKVHRDKYDYSKTVYVNNYTKVCIICPEHGEFWQRAGQHLKGCNCAICAKDNKKIPNKTLGIETFIERANKTHNNKYDYSKAVYINSHNKVCIICPTHGMFKQEASEHLRGRGCPKCGNETVSIKQRKNKIYNIAVFDTNAEDKNIQKIWRRMLDRCYSPHYQKYNSSYIGCSVCDEWLLFSNFQKWVLSPLSGYKKDYHLDKDILVKGNRIYSPETCCFVPRELNEMFTHTNNSLRKGYSITKNRFYVRVYFRGKYIGGKLFDNIEDAIAFYQNNKMQNIRTIADEYFREHKITEKVYNALMNYEVEIRD